MLTYEPDDTLAHRLDPRAKLAVQIGFAGTALAHTTIPALAILSVLTAGILYSARVSLLRTLVAYRFALVILAIAPLIAALTIGPPWIDWADGQTSLQASYRVLLILLVSAAYVRSTPIRDSRAAIQRTIPGKPGQLLGIGIALVFRFLPVIQRDIQTIRDAMAARLGGERRAVDRVSTLGIRSLARAFERADRLSLALQARCFAWNPTLPPLAFSRRDWVVLGFALALGLTAFL
ncbi:energy-coupling factor transporter transmembrane protein EcfT [Natronolimnobius sp. AArcel1]|uniref:energy-coupling factor transporter transmembrane component T family protein n=1 Tax=Natronolimnobius sp. AArcel1 TaxID=1679093 RepID=UPI0013ED6627|nr:energy-coupling factor transporter transmembrane component T [Natronolimnobius sp. AArcel1]NGM67718.1 energy-coupling factor transporter transmembrane protein EcfT [Natronolimnobius sp. AArcel1]